MLRFGPRKSLWTYDILCDVAPKPLCVRFSSYPTALLNLICFFRRTWFQCCADWPYEKISGLLRRILLPGGQL